MTKRVLVIGAAMVVGIIASGTLFMRYAPMSQNTNTIQENLTKTINELDTYTMDTGISIHFFGIQTYSDVVTNIDNTTGISYSKSDTSAEFPDEAKDVVSNTNLSLTIENYNIVNGDTTDSYFTSKEDNEKWFHTRLNYVVGEIDYSWIKELLIESESIEVNGKECVKLAGVVDYGKLASLIDTLGMNNVGIEGVDEKQGEATVILYMENNNKYRPVRLEVDLKQSNKNANKEYEADELIASEIYNLLLNDFKLSFYIDYTNFNKDEASVKNIPEDIIKNATER